MTAKALELEYWYRLFNSTQQEWNPENIGRGCFCAFHEDENLFREACAYHISRLNFHDSKVRYTLRGVEYLPGEKAPESFLS